MNFRISTDSIYVYPTAKALRALATVSVALLLTTATVTLPILGLFAQTPPSALQGQSLDSISEKKQIGILKQFNGKTIRSISIHVKDVFDDPEMGSLYQVANNLKKNTRDEVVKRELLFKEGDAFDALLIGESERVLRRVRYLRNVHIVPVLTGDMVDIKVEVQDTWTFIPQINYSSGGGTTKRSVGIAESNFLGYGKRFEALIQEDEKRSTTEFVYEDPRVMGTLNRVLLAYFDRSDGERTVFSVGQPFRSLVDKTSWVFSSDTSNSVGRLYRDATERFIFRQKLSDLSARFTLSRGNPESELSRYSIGYDYSEARFLQANQKDYSEVGLDPTKVSNDPTQLATNRRYTGPVMTYEDIIPDYIQMNYIDRFDRIQDYNLGDDYSLNLQLAPQALGSSEDALLFSGSKSKGYQFSPDEFIRGEVGFASRYENAELQDTILRFETKYYHVLGPHYLGGLFLGKHTLAADFFVDYGRNLNRDREFTAGADNILRGYKAQSFNGDKRFGFNVEDRVHIADDVFHLVSIGAAVFFDAGGASSAPLGTLIADQTYSDVGFGLRFAFPRSSGGSIVRTDIAFPLRDAETGDRQFQLRIVFAGGQLFGSDLRSESFGPEKANVAIGLDR